MGFNRKWLFYKQILTQNQRYCHSITLITSFFDVQFKKLIKCLLPNNYFWFTEHFQSNCWWLERAKTFEGKKNLKNKSRKSQERGTAQLPQFMWNHGNVNNCHTEVIQKLATITLDNIQTIQFYLLSTHKSAS